MLRRKPGATATLDDIDRELLAGVELELPWRVLLHSASCNPDDAEVRILRLLQVGHLEGKAGDADERRPSSAVHSAVTQPPPSSQALEPRASRSDTGHSAVTQRPPSTPSAAPSALTQPPPAPFAAPVRSDPPAALAARDALLRELAARRSGTSYPPIGTHRKPSEPALPAVNNPGYYSMRPDNATESTAPRPNTAAQQRPLEPKQTRAESLPPGYSVRPGSIAPLGSIQNTVNSSLARLIDEFAHGQDIYLWAAARLREALEEEVAGNVQQAIAVLQLVMAQLSDPRIRAERDRLQAGRLKASSGVYRAQARDAERALKHAQAAESWRKVLEACPNDAEAALHAAACSMEIGDLRQAGVFARRAVELAPDNVIAHRILLRFFRKTGMEQSANREKEILRKLAKG